MLQIFTPAGSRLMPSDEPRRRLRTGPYTMRSSGGMGTSIALAKPRPRHVACVVLDKSGALAGFPKPVTGRLQEGLMKARPLVLSLLIAGLMTVGTVASRS